MPQFDNINFFNQIFWTFSFFLILYFIILKDYLPFYSIVLKTRKKLFLLKKNFNYNLIKNKIITVLSFYFLMVKDISELKVNLIQNYNIYSFKE